MHATAAKAGGLAGGVESRHDVAVAAEHTRVEVGLEATQRFPGQDVELDGDQGAVGGIENPVRRRGPDQPVADISSCVVDVHHLRILDVGIADLAIARLDLGLQVLQFQQTVAGQRVHAGDEIGEVVAHHEVGAVGLEGFHRSRAPLLVARRAVISQLLPVRSGFCSEPDSANSFLMMLWVSTNHE